MSDRRKVCTSCRKELPVSEFYRKSGADGYRPLCKLCHRQSTAARRDSKLTEIRAQERARTKRRTAMGLVKPRVRDLEKERAHWTIKSAVRCGKLKRGQCEVCGSPEAHGHHDDYSKRLDVRWLCSAHHRQHHKGKLTLEFA